MTFQLLHEAMGLSSVASHDNDSPDGQHVLQSQTLEKRLVASSKDGESRRVGPS